MTKKKLYNYLKKYNQEQLLTFYDQLSENEKNVLTKQIYNTDFSLMNKLYKNSFFDETIDIKKISNLPCIISMNNEKRDYYAKIGENLIKNGNYSVLIMAGGLASRLNSKCPKGCLEIKINNKKSSLFEIFINQIKSISKKYNKYIHLFIMTSNFNNELTIDFFEKNNYFDYPKEYIHFFSQNDLPILDKKGKILLKSKNEILYGPNGNGDVFDSLKRNDMIRIMKKNNIKYVLFSTVDNILTNLIDLTFIGITVDRKYKLATKTISKENENEKDWVFCKYKNKPFMLPSAYINSDITNITDSDGNYTYREKNITYHLIHIDSIEKFSNKKLKYHRAYKKNDYTDLNGEYIEASEPNSFKFEKFIFDAFYFDNDMLLYRTDKKEFLPIKTEKDIKYAEKEIKKSTKFNF